MRWLLIAILVLLVLGLFYFTPQTKELIGFFIQLLEPAKDGAVVALTP